MSRVIGKEEVADLVREALPKLAFELPTDIKAGLADALERETSPRAAEALRLLVENARIAHEDRVAICQDTGSVWVCLEIGPNVCIAGDVLDGVDEAVAYAYTEGNLRKSLVRDALFDRSNTGDNTPAFAEIHTSELPGARVHIMCKGGGSDNASRVVMLTPSAGRQVIIGVGVGSTFDKVAGLAKMALMRPLDVPAPDEMTDALERELLEAVNATGIGAAALGGKTTAIGVRVKTAPCHIAALPLAVNMGCSAMRRGTFEL